MSIDYRKRDQEEGARYLNAFIEAINADHDDVIRVGRDQGCMMRNEIERLRGVEKRALLQAADKETER